MTKIADTLYWGADKSLARPGRQQATATEDFEAILTVHLRYYVEIKCQLDATDYIYCRFLQ